MSMIPMPPGATLAISTTALALNVRCETREHFDQVIRFMASARELFGDAEPPSPTRQEIEDTLRACQDAVSARRLGECWVCEDGDERADYPCDGCGRPNAGALATRVPGAFVFEPQEPPESDEITF
jgi:hypothetical protein